MPLQRSPAEIFGRFGDALRGDIYKCMPATVLAVNPSKQTVDVQVAINGVIFDELGTAVSVPAPSFTGIPLGVIRGGGFLVWVPVVVGDSVLLVFSDLSADTWRSGDGTPTDPGWVGLHTCDSPFALPMVAPDAKVLTSTPGDKLVIGKDGGSTQIIISATDIELGSPAGDAVGLASKIDTNNANIKTALGASAITTPAQALAAIAALQVLFNAPPSPLTIQATGSSLVKCG